MDAELLMPLIVYVAAAGYVTKVLIDMARRFWVLPSQTTPVFACGVGVVSVALIMMMNGIMPSTRMMATAVLSGLLSGAAAVAGTELARSGDGQQTWRRLQRIEKDVSGLRPPPKDLYTVVPPPTGGK